jgi:hypothetical protein
LWERVDTLPRGVDPEVSGEAVPDQPDWHLVALLLVAASGYE